jgi:ribonuclease D
MPPSSDFTLVTTQEQLAACCEQLAKAGTIMIDTEFMREKTYFAQLCLIQLADDHQAYAIDPLAEGLDLNPFLNLMANEKVLKVFHAGRQDMEILYFMSGTIPHPVFDTQIAASVCGFGDSVSYEQLVKKITGAQIDKSQRFTDWSRRPLNDRQQAYAIADVTHLRALYAFLDKTLMEQGRHGWIDEEMAILTDPRTYQNPPEEAWKRLKLRINKPLDLLVLQKLAAWREEQAQKRDLPRRHVLKDDALYELAVQRPQKTEALASLRSFPKGQAHSAMGQDVIRVIRTALEIPQEDWPLLPKSRHMPEGKKAMVELLKIVLKITCDEAGLAPKIVATVDDLEALAADDEADIHALKGWRRDIFGQKALALKKGELALTFQNNRAALIALNERGESERRAVS